MTAKEATALLPNRTYDAVKNRRTLLGLNRIQRRDWTEEDLRYIEQSNDSTYRLAKHFGVTESSINSVKSKNGIYTKKHCKHCGSEMQSYGTFCKAHNEYTRKMGYYRNSVKKRGGDLNDDDIYNTLSSNCHYCGSEEALGIDRIDSSVGYFKDNIVPACWDCNQMKNDKDIDTWLRQTKKLLEHYHDK